MKGIIPLAGFLVLLTGLNTRNVYGQDTLAAWDIFVSDSVLELVLYVDLDSLLSDVGKDPSYHSAILVYNDPRDHSLAEMDISIRTRGKFRKKPKNCDFPPLKIKFSKHDRQGSIFEDYKNLKLVTHCQSEPDEFEQYLLQEYLIYRAYNIFTDFSFRVRLARITYADLPSGLDSMTRFAFLLENPGDMAKRNHGELLELETVSSDKLDRRQLTLMSVFNYMIHNTDFSIPIVHNIELVSLDHFKPPLPVPYDFDWSGIINVPYDSPYAASKTRYTDRHYKGPCIKRKEFELVFSEMLSKRDRLYRLYNDFPYIDQDLKSRSIQELNMFFIIIGSRELIRQEFLKNCHD